MIPTAELAAWIASPEAQRASQDKVDAFSAAWKVSPLITETSAGLAALQPDDVDGILRVARRCMDMIQNDDAAVADLLTWAQDDDFFRPPLATVNSEIGTALVLFHNHQLSLALGVTSLELLAAKKAHPRASASIGFTGHHMLLRYLKAGDARVALWEASVTGHDLSADAPAFCHPTGHRLLADGDELLIDGHRQSFVIEHASSDLVYIQAMVREDISPVTAEYDSKSLRLIGLSSTDEVSSRVQMLASLLRALGRDEAAPLIAKFLDTPHFHARWYLMREVLAMDAEVGYPHLKQMAASDPHPEVRAAAAQTLDMFFGSDAAQLVEA